MSAGTRTGRPSKFTPEVADLVLNALGRGALLADAAAFAGISRETLHQWMTHPSTPEMEDFSDAVSKARTSVKLEAVERVVTAGRGDWRASAWWLGVTDPRNYGPKIRVTLEEEFSNALQRIERKLPPDVFERVLEAIAEGDGGADADEPAVPDAPDDAPPA